MNKESEQLLESLAFKNLNPVIYLIPLKLYIAIDRHIICIYIYIPP